ncbi:MAG TPA: toprim domain-containing protein, partial [Saprospiraceae bacterium]|nr:toprim domain-containing protein [Saprospiraceae bacterium]
MTLEDLHIEVKESLSYVTTCPECSASRKPNHRKEPCLSVKRLSDYSIWNCHNCGYSGSTVDHDKYKNVREQAKMPKVKASIYSKEVNVFLASKQISTETALKCSCYEFSTDFGKVFSMPYYYRGNMVNVMFRQMKEGEKRVWQVKKESGTKTCFWGLEMLNLASKNEIIITEGQTDRMTLVQCGYENVLSVPMGAPAPGQTEFEKKLKFVTDPYIVKLFEKVEKVYLAVDNDAAGIFLRDLLADKLGKDRCYLLNYPKAYKDSNEVYAGDAKKNLDPLGKPGVEAMFNTARPYPVRGVMRVWDLMPQIMKFRNNGYEKGLICGHEQVDRLFSIQKKRLMIISGISGHGKSSWNRWYLVELCKKNPELKF